MRFVCFGHINEKAWEQLSEADQATILNDYFEYYKRLKETGHFLKGEGLKGVDYGCRIEIEDSTVKIKSLSANKEQIGGYFILEAIDFEEAKEIVSNHPGLKIGAFEVREVDEELSKLVGAI